MAGVRTFHHEMFDPVALAKEKESRVISVIISARDEETTIGGIVEAIRTQLLDAVPLVDEILVIDDRSEDRTRTRAVNADARVVSSNDVLADLEPTRGKGGALWKGFRRDRRGAGIRRRDVPEFDPRFVVGLVGPLLTPDHHRRCVRQRVYERPLDDQRRGGRRVTELTARPLLSILLDHPSDIVQPLAGAVAVSRSTLERLPFVEGYGVDIRLVADAAATVGTDAIAQVDLGRRIHRNRPIHELGRIATEVLLAALTRALVAIPRTTMLNVPDHES